MTPTHLPRVTILVITYNHARYIAKALDSILEQKTDYPVTIHVLDDCSIDGAPDIIRDYAARYPGKVVAHVNPKNIGRKVTQRNFYRGFMMLDGDYIAILEGDDYWASNTKLQTQIDFLEAHPDYVACAHNTTKVYEDGSKEPHLFLPPQARDTFDIYDLISIQTYFHTSSLTYRNVLRGRAPRQLRNPLSCDIFITIAHAEHGKIRFFPESMSVYRQHASGVFSGMTPEQGWKFNIDGLRKYNAWLGYRHWPAFSKAIYLYSDYMLRHGKNLSAWIRFKYGALAKVYRWLAEKAPKPPPVITEADRAQSVQ